LWAADLESKTTTAPSLTTSAGNNEGEVEVEMPSLAGIADKAKKEL
jgi:hypothetical protein